MQLELVLTRLWTETVNWRKEFAAPPSSTEIQSNMNNKSSESVGAGGPTAWWILTILISALGLGCEHTYKETKIGNQPAPTLRSDARVYIARPFDVEYKKQVIQNSGKNTASALLDSFNRFTKSAFAGKMPESLPQALESARKIHAQYLVYPHILRWEDHSTEFTGIRDKLKLDLSLIDTESGSTVFAREIDARSRWMTDGGDTPQDLLSSPVDNFVASLYRVIETPTSLR